MNIHIHNLCQRLGEGDEVVLHDLIKHAYQPLLVQAKMLLNDDRMAQYLEPEDLVSGVFESIQKCKKPVQDFKAYSRTVMRTLIQERARYETRDMRMGKKDASGRRATVIRIDDFMNTFGED